MHAPREHLQISRLRATQRTAEIEQALAVDAAVAGAAKRRGMLSRLLGFGVASRLAAATRAMRSLIGGRTAGKPAQRPAR